MVIAVILNLLQNEGSEVLRVMKTHVQKKVVIQATILLTAGGAVALWFVRSFLIKQSGFKSWPRTLCCVVGQHTLLLRCLSPPRCINLTLACDLILVPAKGFFRKVVVYYVPFIFAMHLLKILNTIICTAQVLLLCVKSCLPPWHNYSEIDDILLPIQKSIVLNEGSTK